MATLDEQLEGKKKVLMLHARGVEPEIIAKLAGCDIAIVRYVTKHFRLEGNDLVDKREAMVTYRFQDEG